MAEIKRVHDITRLEIFYFGWPADERQMMQVDMAIAGMDDENIDDAAIEWFAEKFELAHPDGPTWDSNPQVLILNGKIGVYVDEVAE